MDFNAAKKLYRKTDPESSKLAVYSGPEKIKKHRQLFYSLLKENEGLTSAELGALLDGDTYYWRNVASRRLADLANDNKAKRSNIRLCSVTNRNCVTWILNNEETADGL